MVDAELELLAARVASALVTSMTTDEWPTLRTRLVQLLERTVPRQAALVADELDEARRDLTTAAAARDAATTSDVEAMLRHRLRRLLRAEGELAPDLGAFLAEPGAVDDRAPTRAIRIGHAPSHYVILAVDLARFAAYDTPMQVILRRSLYDGVHQTLAAAGVPPDATQIEDRGDGMLVLLNDAVSLPGLLSAVLRDLPEFVASWNSLAASSAQMKVRVVVHQGLAVADAHGWTGAALNDAARLLDHSVLRGLMNTSRNPVVVSVSDSVYQSVVRHHYPRVPVDSFRDVVLTTKSGHITAWINDPEGLLEKAVATAVPQATAIRGYVVAGDGPDADGGALLDISDRPEVAAATRAMGSAFDRIFQALGPPPEDLLMRYRAVTSDGGGSAR
ncbi:hypothetical protein ACFYXH_32560 [Streptomyces sp. NPDC002730]|uniref:hypothetical protein n=1 Tax=Streptomyces sp. NPDC002730 TaxID=3364662 RepID=UPI003689B401